MTDCLADKPSVDLLHFAVHGSYDPNGIQDGIVLLDGTFLNPMDVRGAILPRHPFVFLNACQVGQGNRILGDYGGMAEAFLFARSSAVIAPLWSIEDIVAKQIAIEFYQGNSTKPAQYLREARARFTLGPVAQSATYLAYQYFGHPELRLQLPPVLPGDTV